MAAPIFYTSPRSIKDRQRRYLDAAAAMALRSPMNHRHGCVIVYRDEIIAAGTNRPLDWLQSAWSMHAECDALRQLRGRRDCLPQCELYIIKLGHDHILRNSKPCSQCEQQITEAGIRRVYYSCGPDASVEQCLRTVAFRERPRGWKPPPQQSM